MYLIRVKLSKECHRIHLPLFHPATDQSLSSPDNVNIPDSRLPEDNGQVDMPPPPSPQLITYLERNSYSQASRVDDQLPEKEDRLQPAVGDEQLIDDQVSNLNQQSGNKIGKL